MGQTKGPAGKRVGAEVVATAPRATQRNLAREGIRAAQAQPVPKGTNYGFLASEDEYIQLTRDISSGQKVKGWASRVGEQHSGCDYGKHAYPYDSIDSFFLH